MWRCPDSFHEETVSRIARELGLSEGDPGTMLEQRGWVHVMDNGYVLRTVERLTQPQIDALFDLAQAYPSMQQYLMHALEVEQGHVPRDAEGLSQAKGHFNEMIDIEQEARRRGISLSH